MSFFSSRNTLSLPTILLSFSLPSYSTLPPFLDYVHPRLHHAKMATWSTACTKGILVFRVLREQDDASQGIYPRDPYATLTIDEHIAKGPTSSMGSQYISTTRNINLAIYMAIKRCSTLSIIICALLDQDIELLDLSSGHHCLSQDCNNTTIALSEVLLRPRINTSAICTISYSAMCDFDATSYYLLHQTIYWVTHSRVLKQSRCHFCHALGHNDDGCSKFDEWIVEENGIDRYLSFLPLCSICKEYHEIFDCPSWRFDLL